jgi:hypothetical protein
MNEAPVRHFDEARRSVQQILEQLDRQRQIERAVLSPDIFARIRVALWYAPAVSAAEQAEIEARLSAAAGPFWGGLWAAAKLTGPADRDLLNALWEEGAPRNAADRIRINERSRGLSVWLRYPLDPPWLAGVEDGGPPIVSFYAFKGGAGRTTALAIFAAQRAQAGERVVVVDLDLSAPGAGVLLETDVVPEAGVVDYWLEQPIMGDALDLRDYYYRVSNPAVIGPGEILVFAAGRFDDLYVAKLARLDYTPPVDGKHPLEHLLLKIRHDLRPDWILLDARAGISEAAGFALGGLAHLNVLFGGASDSSWRGLRLAVRRLGAARAQRGLPQDECILVHSMVPANPQTAELSATEFLRRAEATFEQEYYLPDPADPDDDQFWYVRDMSSRDAPHAPVALAYSERIAFFTGLEHLIGYGLQAPDYRDLGNRITARFPRAS